MEENARRARQATELRKERERENGRETDRTYVIHWKRGEKHSGLGRAPPKRNTNQKKNTYTHARRWWGDKCMTA
jgi:hypothetical protein